MRMVTEDSSVSLDAMHSVKADAIRMKEYLLKGDMQSMASGFQRSWEAKKRTSSVVSNSNIENIFTIALKSGAIAGKVSGAGGGGYIMFFIDPCKREQLTRALSLCNGVVQRFQFTPCGVEFWSIR